MFGSDILEAFIGLVFVYFIVSLLCSTLTEWFARAIAMRASTLKDGIVKLLSDEELKDQIFKHPLIQGLSPKKQNSGPSNIPSGTFALALFDILTAAGGKNKSGTANIDSSGGDIDEKGKSKSLREVSRQTVDSLEKSIESLQNNDATKKVLKAFLTSAKSRVDSYEDVLTEFRTSVEKWFDSSMERVSGWYKRKSQFIIILLAAAICFGLNIDTFVIANSLYQDNTLRASVVAAAEKQAAQTDTEASNSTSDVATIRQDLEGLKLPIGWTSNKDVPNKKPVDPWGWVSKVVGTLITAFAVSLGAPFWFDLLNKIVNLRAAGKKPATTEEIKPVTSSVK